MWQNHDSHLFLITGNEAHRLTSRSNRRRVLEGVAVGASAGAAVGVLAWALHTLPKAVACDIRNWSAGFGSDVQPTSCNYRAYRRRAQYTWTGLVLGGLIGGIIGRTRDSEETSQP